MRRVAVIFSLLTMLFLIITILSLNGGCAAPEPENVFLELLGLLPVEVRGVPVITIINYQKIFEDSSISLYDAEGNRINYDDLVDIMIEKSFAGQFFGEDVLSVSDSFYTGLTRFMSGPINKENVGFDSLDSEAEISIYGYSESSPSERNKWPDYLLAARGKYNALATEEALKNREEWPQWALELYTTEVYNDVTIHSWGDGNERHSSYEIEPPHIDIFGRARPLAICDGYLFIASSVADIKQMIDAYKNTRDSLADISDYALAAQAIYDMDVYNMILINPVQLDPESYNRNVFYTGFGLKDTVLVASGQGEDEKGKYVAVAYVQEDESSAEFNMSYYEAYLDYPIDIFSKAIQDLFEWKLGDHIREKEICTEGRVLTAKIYLDDEGFNWWWYPSTVMS